MVGGAKNPEILCAVFPLGKPLDKEVLQERLTVYGPVFGALRTYRAPDARRSRHILVKDNIAVDGFPTTAGSRALLHLKLPESVAATRLKTAGFDLFGKTNMTEFAGFVTTGRPSEGYSHLGGFGKNPHGNFLCGGSSSGSAIAVAAGLCDAALGTETRGSVMEPALYCGVWGFKPSVGLISRRGVIPISPVFDTVGVLSRDVGMLSDLLTALQGEDEHDTATALSSSVHLDEGKDIQARTLRIGVVRVTGTETLDAEVQEILKVAFRKFMQAGVRLTDVSAENPPEDYKLITSVDFARGVDALLKEYATQDVPPDFASLCALYCKTPSMRPFGMDRMFLAQKLSSEVSEKDYQEAVKRTVTSNRTAIDALLSEYRVDALLFPGRLDWWALAGAPSLAVPIGVKKSGQSVGVMLGAGYGQDGILLGIARVLEEVLCR
ncbi:MAG: amidase family protein [Duodenibacillus sp.]|nr:amidase family protein [Duodenibacillus sp.]